MIVVGTLHRITGSTGMAERKAALLARLDAIGGPLNEPAVVAQFMAQVLHESGGFRYVREVWGPTKAQAGYEGRRDLGNTRAGDGKRFMGRDLIQVTGRVNYRALTAWAATRFDSAPDFEAEPERLESPEWLGVGAIWYFLTRPRLIDYCRAGNIEMVTRTVNGGLNGYPERLRWYDHVALAMLGFESVRAFQARPGSGLVVDGISGPLTRAAMHGLLMVRGRDAPPYVSVLVPSAQPAPMPPAPPVAAHPRTTSPVVAQKPAETAPQGPLAPAAVPQAPTQPEPPPGLWRVLWGFLRAIVRGNRA